MKTCLSYLVLFSSLISPVFADNFPKGPDAQLTPGSLCDRPTQKRYPEGIPYCERSVASGLKKEIFRVYDEQRGYNTGSMKRTDFKIDHYIPLCMGGSNKPDNLWPQHRTVYEITDPVEGLACEKLAEGALRQAEAVELVRRAKANLNEVPRILEYVRGL